ncbi:hypothetical protein ACTFIR_006474 [Dictyostelium discoideum]
MIENENTSLLSTSSSSTSSSPNNANSPSSLNIGTSNSENGTPRKDNTSGNNSPSAQITKYNGIDISNNSSRNSSRPNSRSGYRGDSSSSSSNNNNNNNKHNSIVYNKSNNKLNSIGGSNNDLQGSGGGSNGNGNGSSKYKIGINNKDVEEKIEIKKQKKMNRTNNQKFWRIVGSILQIIGLSSIVFTIFIGLYIDGYIDWSYWILFIPVYVILAASYLATGSRVLSNLVSWIIRLVWRLSVFGLTVFVVFTIIHFKYNTFGFSVMMIPLLFTFGSVFVMGIFSLLFGIIFVDGKSTPQRKTKYIVNGLPLLFIGAILTPTAIMIALKLDGLYDAKLAVCFVSLFIGDIIASCFSFFLLIFSLGSKDTATFSIGQLLSIIFITICSIVFKVLLILATDQQHNINSLFLLIPLLVAEAFMVFCGINLFLRPPRVIVDNSEELAKSNMINNQDSSESESDDETEVSFKDREDEESEKLISNL